jgi:hypothetical protein
MSKPRRRRRRGGALVRLARALHERDRPQQYPMTWRDPTDRVIMLVGYPLILLCVILILAAIFH